MRKVDQGEFYSSKENQGYSECKTFKAEEYYGKEIGKTADEEFSVSEFSSSYKTNRAASEEFLDTQDLQQQINNVNPVSTTSSTSATTHAVAESTAVASGATASITVAAAASTAVAAIAGISILAPSSVVEEIPESTPIVEPLKGITFSKNNMLVGADYVLFDLDANNFNEADQEIGSDERDYVLELSFENEVVNQLAVVEGSHEYLFPHLTRSSEYQVNLVAYGNSEETTSNYYSEIFTTKETSAPRAIFDEFNSSFSFDEEYKIVSYDYSIYLSDPDNEFKSCSILATTDEGFEYENRGINEEHYLTGTIDRIVGNTLNLDVRGFEPTGASSLLLTKSLPIPFPEGWDDIKIINGITLEEESSRVGADYILLKLNAYDFDAADQELNSSTRDYVLELSFENEVVDQLAVVEGSHEYLFPRLTRSSEYQVNLVAYGDSEDTTTNYYSKTFVTEESSTPCAILNEFNSSFSFDEEYKIVSYDYSIYFSDPDIELKGCSLLATTDAGFEYGDEIGDSSYDLTGTINDIKGNILTLEVRGIGGRSPLLLLQDLPIPFPEGWDDIVPKQKLEFSDPSETTETPNSVTLIGECVENIETEYEYFVDFIFLDADENTLSTNEGTLFFDNNKTQYTVSSDIPYGITYYKFEIYHYSDEGRIVAYASENTLLTAEQSIFQASLNKPQLGQTGATIKYNSDDPTLCSITLETNFEIEEYDSIYSYSVELINTDTDEIVDSKENITSSVVEFTNIDSSLNLAVKYYELGTFAGEIHQYAEYNYDTSVQLSKPSVEFEDNYFVNENNVVINYKVTKPSTVIDVNLHVYVYVDDEFVIDYLINNPGEEESIVLETLEATSGTLKLEYSLEFKCDADENTTQQLPIETKTYQLATTMNFNDMTIDSSSEMVQPSDGSYFTELKLGLIYEDDLILRVTNDTGRTLYSGEPQTKIMFYGINSNTTSITVQLLDQNGAVVSEFSRDIENVNIDNQYSISFTNPGDSYVTYNDDGTMNVYRNVGFTTMDGDISYRASLYSDSEYDETLNKDIPNIVALGESNGYYSVIENVDASRPLFFLYQIVYKPYNSDITYVVKSERPSGGINEEIFADGSISQDDNKIQLYFYNEIQDSIVYVNGVPYEFNYDGQTYSYMMDEYVENPTIRFMANMNYMTPEDLIEDGYDLEIKGSPYREISFTIPTN